MPLRKVYEKLLSRIIGWIYWNCGLGDKGLDRQLAAKSAMMNLNE